MKMTEPADAATVEIVVNGAAREVPTGLTAAGLLDRLDLHPGMVVVELNREIVRREQLSTLPIRAGDRIELVHFVGGG